MRLKEDTTNWNASNIQRKMATLPEVGKHRSKKNTRKWCKGKVGVTHDVYVKEIHTLNWHLSTNWKWIKWNCENCGKDFSQHIEKDRD